MLLYLCGRWCLDIPEDSGPWAFQLPVVPVLRVLIFDRPYSVVHIVRCTSVDIHGLKRGYRCILVRTYGNK